MVRRELWASGGMVVGAVVALLVARPQGSWSRVAAPPDVHAEYVKYASGGDSIRAYVAYPLRKDAAPGIVVIHEIFGLSDFVRQSVERLAREGFVAMAPDLLSHRGGTPASADSARRLIASLNPDTITQDLDAGVAYLKSLSAVRAEQIGVIGFCWGGGESFRYATRNRSLGAFVVCYGPTPNLSVINSVRVPGYGIYADKDARINQQLADLSIAVAKAHVDYKFKVYPDVGHGFLRTREDPKIADQAWSDAIHFFKLQLEGASGAPPRPPSMPR